jgi:hypothetical protein
MRGEPTLAAARWLTADVSASLRSMGLFEYKDILNIRHHGLHPCNRVTLSQDTSTRHSGNFPHRVADAKFAL